MKLIDISNHTEYKRFIKSLTINKSKRTNKPLPYGIIAKISDYEPSNIFNLLLTGKYVERSLLNTITVLELDGNNVEDKHLKLVPNLRYLILKENLKVTNEGIKVLKHLKHLDLRETEI